jgi:hypothetical protein
MIARPLHEANRGVVAAGSALDAPGVSSADLEATVDRVTTWGGDAALYRHFLAAALGAEVEPSSVRALGAIAGWRSGVLDLRVDALARATSLAAGGAGAAVAAALGLPVGRLDAFLSRQAVDPFAWPGAGTLVATVGGFAGLGGRWTAPPEDPVAVGDAEFAVRSGLDWWLVTVDVFGSRTTRLETAPPAGASAHARITTTPDSYLASIVRPEPEGDPSIQHPGGPGVDGTTGGTP